MPSGEDPEPRAPEHNDGPGGDPWFLDELFPVRADPKKRLPRPDATKLHRPPASVHAARARTKPAAPAPEASAPNHSATEAREPVADGDPRPTSTHRSWRRAAAVAVACVVPALAVRLVLTRALPAGDVHHLSTGELGLGVLVVVVAAGLCGRVGVAASACLAMALALATVDVAAPVGIGLVLVAVLASRRR